MELFRSLSLWIFILCLNFVKGSFVVNVTQSSYHAEENHNITLEWKFRAKSDTFTSSLKILCSLTADQKQSTLYFLHDGIEVSEVQDEEFSGRVHSDKDALKEGRIRLQLSRLRTEDSGLYLCEVSTGDGSGYNSCRVTVSEPKPGKPETTQQTRSLQPPDLNKDTKDGGRGGMIMVVFICVSLILGGGGGCLLIQKCQKQSDSSLHTAGEFLMKGVSASEPSDLVSGLKPTAGNGKKKRFSKQLIRL